MALPPSSKIQINLSKTKTHETVEKTIFKWTTNVGKLIIIVTELVALGALGYRFLVDGQIVDLHDKIHKEEQLIQLKQNDEKKYRDIQTRLSYIKSITKDSQAKVALLRNILSSIKSGALSTTNVVVNQNSILVSGISPTVVSVNNFVDSLKKDQNVESISIDEFNSISEGIKVRIRITMKELQQKL